MNLRPKTLFVVAIASMFASLAGGQSSRPGYLDRTSWRFVPWSAVTELSPKQKEASDASLKGDRVQARKLLLALKGGREDSVWIRKALLDQESRPDTVAAGLREILRKKRPLSREDILDLGYRTAWLRESFRRGVPQVDLPLIEVLGGIREILTNKPTLAERIAAGFILMEVGTVGETRKAFADAAQVAPKNAHVHLVYAASLIHFGSNLYPAKPQEALHHALAAVEDDPTLAEAYRMVADCYVDLKQSAKADAYYIQYVKHGDPSSKSVKAIREYLVKRGVKVK